MFMHLRGGGIRHKATWDWNEVLECDSGARTSGGVGVANSDDMMDSEGEDRADEQELDEEEPGDEDEEGEDKDRNEEQQTWDTVMVSKDSDDEDDHGNVEGDDRGSDSEEEVDEDDVYGLEGYGAL